MFLTRLELGVRRVGVRAMVRYSVMHLSMSSPTSPSGQGGAIDGDLHSLRLEYIRL